MCVRLALIRINTFLVIIPESGRELRSAHRTIGNELESELAEVDPVVLNALSAILFSSDRNMTVWISLTSEYSGSQCM